MRCESVPMQRRRRADANTPDAAGRHPSRQATRAPQRPKSDGSMTPMAVTAGAQFDRLLDIMRTLRAPGGCPWDREQTHASLRPFVLEETYEVLEAIDSGSS